MHTKVLFLCTHKHTTLTTLSSIMQNFSSSLCTTILELWLTGAVQSSVNVTKWLTRNWQSSRLLINVSERKHNGHKHVTKHAIMHSNTRTFWAITVNNATIKCEQQCKPKLSATKIYSAQYLLHSFANQRECRCSRSFRKQRRCMTYYVPTIQRGKNPMAINTHNSIWIIHPIGIYTHNAIGFVLNTQWQLTHTIQFELYIQ